MTATAEAGPSLGIGAQGASIRSRPRASVMTGVRPNRASGMDLPPTPPTLFLPSKLRGRARNLQVQQSLVVVQAHLVLAATALPF